MPVDTQQQSVSQENQSGDQAPKSGQGSAPAISLPKGGGAIRGIGEKFSTNPVTGTGSMSVPIAVTPARSSFSPQLTLAYDSGSGNGPFGFGWSLSLPVITRKTDKGLPKYRDREDSDVFVLSGAEDLVPSLIAAENSWHRDSLTRTVDSVDYVIDRYRPRVEGLFAVIERWTDRQTGESHWRTISKDNIATFYGKTSASRIFDPDHPQLIFSWLICESRDDKGNAILYNYVPENSDNVDLTQANERNRTVQGRSVNRYLKRIKYGNRTSHLIQPDLTQTDWLFELVFDYGEGHYQDLGNAANGQLVSANISGTQPWPVRQDSFSVYRAGFESRTYRLCRRALMFHHFPDELGTADYLVRSTDFEYKETPIASFITGITQSGYVQNTNQTYLKKSMPPVEFVYSEAVINTEVKELDSESITNLPYGLDGTKYQWVDLDGEGISGILTEQSDSWLYKSNLGQGRLGPTQVVSATPSLADLSGGQQLLDLAGDGQLDLVQFSSTVPGFHERTEEGGWSNFTPFPSLPRVDWHNPNLKFVDLTGDGHADLLIAEDQAFTWYESLGEAGFAFGGETRQAFDEEKSPRLVFADGLQSVFVADMSGDGLGDLVRVRNGEVCFWPNLGYGRFGTKVTMDQSPQFDTPDQFEGKRIRLADIDGSGLTDIIYLNKDGIHLYFNQSGNSWSAIRKLEVFPAVDNLSTVTVVDLLGNGTACVVWSSPLPEHSRRPLRYVELMAQKPHLLLVTKNNMGAETHMQYASSTKFYLADKAAGKPWITRLPFPVHVVERVETLDRISRNRFVNRYTYHHGYFDGIEREFRGFGMVEQLDTEEFATLSSSDTLPDATNVDQASHVPPVLTRTWFHTGAYFEGGRISKQYEHEYYREGDPSLGEGALTDEELEAMLLPDTVLPGGLSLEEERQACRALKGSMLRQEIYARDKSEKEDRPYSVSERNYTITTVQPRDVNRHSVFFTHARETIDFHYERKLFDVANEKRADPRVTHNVILQLDAFGNVLAEVSIGYGRRFDDPDPVLTNADRAAQKRTLLTLTQNRFTNSVSEPDAHRVPLPAEARTFELLKVVPDAAQPRVTNLFRFNELQDKVAAASDGQHDLPYEDINASGATANQPYRRLIEHIRTLYRSNTLAGPLAPGAVESLALPFESYKLAFTPGLLQQVFGDRVSDAMMSGEGGYVHTDSDQNWWIPAGRSFFSLDATATAPQELDFARRHFFVPRRFVDAFGNATTLSYDAVDVLLVERKDALENSTRARNDYRVMQPRLVTEPNGNRSEVAFDALGFVVGTALMGKEGESVGDSLAGFVADLDLATIVAHQQDALINPHEVLNSATTRLIYDLHRYHRTSATASPEANCVYTVARETHVSELAQGELTKIQHNFAYSDGFDREIQKKIQAEDGPIGAGGAAISPRWVGSGWMVFNNKGKAVRQYEPFFSASHQFEFAKVVGVSSTLFYDPPGRVVATLHPNHTYEKINFDPWREESWDANDTVSLNAFPDDADVSGFLRSLPVSEYAPSWNEQRRTGALGAEEQTAAAQTVVHAATPSIKHFEVLGRPFITVAQNRFERNGSTVNEQYPTRIVVDIEGNQRSIVNALQHMVLFRHYDLLGNRIYERTIDAGERWLLHDVANQPIRSWDSRNHHIRHEYDALRRPTNILVQRDNAAEKLVERIVYGEGQPNDRQQNLRNKIFQQFDGAGIVVNTSYDFKGNLRNSSRQLLQNYRDEVDWKQSPALENEKFNSTTSYDALNRPLFLTMPDGSVVHRIYNPANLLNQVEVTFPGAATIVSLVANIDYNEKGHRTAIEYGNGVRTEYQYDTKTFRLLSCRTERKADGVRLQDLSYTYDPVGNITSIRDASQQTVYFNNQIVSADQRYTYDAAYRLIGATGREHIGQVTQPQPNWNDEFRVNQPHPSDGQAMRNYEEVYEYDGAGNILTVRHVATNGNWTRSYRYDEPNATPGNNRLTSATVGPVKDDYVYDSHGNITRMPHLPLMEWDFRDRLHVIQQQVVNAGTGEKTYFVYDEAGQRARNVTDKVNGSRNSERLYLGPFEVYREYDNGGATSFASWTLHIMEGSERLALIERKTVENQAPVNQPPFVRFQLGDHLSSVITELDQQGAVISHEEYYSYGATAYAANQSNLTAKRYRYAGRERDSRSGFYYYGARYYAPWLGRWISCDQSDKALGQQLYVYVRNNPIVRVDPDGNYDKPIVTPPLAPITPQPPPKPPPGPAPPRGTPPKQKPVEKPKPPPPSGDYRVEILVGGPYTKEGEEHPYGHAAIRVVTPTSDTVYDYGRYGKTWGNFKSEGEGILNVWSDFKSYITGENSLGRTTTGFSFNVSKEQAEAVQSHFAALTSKAEVKLTETTMTRYRIATDYHALNCNCTTISLAPMEKAFPGFQSDAADFIKGRGMSTTEKIAARVAGWPEHLFMPADLKAYLESDTLSNKVGTWNITAPSVKTYKLGAK